jgi:hypothetical protein
MPSAEDADGGQFSVREYQLLWAEETGENDLPFDLQAGIRLNYFDVFCMLLLVGYRHLVKPCIDKYRRQECTALAAIVSRLLHHYLSL